VTQTATAQRIGIDGSEDRIVFATVAFEPAGSKVLSIVEQVPTPELLGTAAVTISVPDDECMIKNLRLQGASREEIESRVRFELSQSVLESAAAFRFELISSSGEDRHIGVAYRRALLEERVEALGLAAGEARPITFLPRSAALGKAYRTFCRPRGGDLICLADFAGSSVSICLLFHGETEALTWMPGSAATADDMTVRRLAVNFKTVVNFKLLSLADYGITVPLSALVVSGAGMNEPLMQALQEYFPIGVNLPDFNISQFTQPDLCVTGVAARSMVALGLAVN
jgi:hypothetical protein